MLANTVGTAELDASPEIIVTKCIDCRTPLVNGACGFCDPISATSSGAATMAVTNEIPEETPQSKM